MRTIDITVVCPHCLHEEEQVDLGFCRREADGWYLRCVHCGNRVYFGVDPDGTVLWTRKMGNCLAGACLKEIRTPFKCTECWRVWNKNAFVVVHDNSFFALCPMCGGATKVGLDSEGRIEGGGTMHEEQEQVAENFYIQQLCAEIGILNAQLDCMKKEVYERQARISELSNTVARLESMLARFRRSVKDGN